MQLLVARGGKAKNLTSFGRQLQSAATKLLPTFLKEYDFGFQDGGCAIFARALTVWSGDRLQLFGLRSLQTNITHVIAGDGRVFLDSDGVGTMSDIILKMEKLEREPGCAIEPFTPEAIQTTVIPWIPAASQRIAADLRPLLPDPETSPWAVL